MQNLSFLQKQVNYYENNNITNTTNENNEKEGEKSDSIYRLNNQVSKLEHVFKRKLSFRDEIINELTSKNNILNKEVGRLKSNIAILQNCNKKTFNNNRININNNNQNNYKTLKLIIVLFFVIICCALIVLMKVKKQPIYTFNDQVLKEEF